MKDVPLVEISANSSHILFVEERAQNPHPAPAPPI